MGLSEEQALRFHNSYERGEGCWLWLRKDITRGYAYFHVSKTPRIRLRAHRVAWLLAYGELDDRLVIHHTCGNKLCVNPAHLEAMPQSDHQHTHTLEGGTCKRGHPYVPHRRTRNNRCAECFRIENRDAQRRRRARRREASWA